MTEYKSYEIRNDIPKYLGQLDLYLAHKRLNISMFDYEERLKLEKLAVSEELEKLYPNGYRNEHANLWYESLVNKPIHKRLMELYREHGIANDARKFHSVRAYYNRCSAKALTQEEIQEKLKRIEACQVDNMMILKKNLLISIVKANLMIASQDKTIKEPESNSNIIDLKCNMES